MQPPSCRRRLAVKPNVVHFSPVDLPRLCLWISRSDSLVAAGGSQSDKCCCPSRTPQRRGNCMGGGTPENVAPLAALFHVLQHGVAGEVEVKSVHAANAIVGWYQSEARRLFAALDIPPIAPGDRRHQCLRRNHRYRPR